jgi:cytochrome c2
VWDKEKLDSFIAKPDEVVLGANCVIVFDQRRSETIL